MSKPLKFCCFILIFLWCTEFIRAQNIEQKVQLLVGTGVQHENFNWSIAGNQNGQNPNVLSELKWKNISGPAYSASLQWNVWRRFSLYGDYNRMAVHSGSVSDIDYSADNRTAPVYTGNFNDNKGYTTSWSTGVGYVIFNNERFSLIPYIGYSTNTEYLYIVDLSGQFPTLNSSYQVNWKGEFVKITSSVKIVHALKLAAAFTYNQAHYTAHGDWNLINEFQHPVSYSHVAEGYGIGANARLVYNITPNVAVNIGYSYYNWQTGTGNDQLYLATGEVDKTQLNGVYRNGFQWVGGVVLSL